MKMWRKILRVPYRAAKGIVRWFEPAVRRRGARSRLWARCYYGLGHPGFAEEQRAFLAGRVEYEKSSASPEGNRALLRRNVHRIEKGLLMKPRRIPFAVDYIGETVTAYASAAQHPHVDPRELQWAFDVLTEYFSLNAQASNVVKTAARRFAEIPAPRRVCAEKLIPYRRDLSQPVPVTYEALWELAKRRRSVRWFRQEPVPRELIDKAIALGALAPSACNRQPFEFRVFDDPEAARKVIEIPFGLEGYGHNVPCIVVVVGKQRNYFAERDRHLIYLDGALAVMGFILALETLGLSSCCVNWPEISANDRQMARYLGLAPDERPIMLVALGFPDPDGRVARSTKKSLNTLRRYNFE